MNTDFRLNVGIFTHPKFVKLKRRLGTEGALSYITLLGFTAQNHPDGWLRNMDADDIAIAGQWEGDARKFVQTLVELRLLDETADGFAIHDWSEHNPYAASASSRSEKARQAANARWGGASQPPMPPQMPSHMPNDTNAMQGADAEDANAMLTHGFSNAPTDLTDPTDLTLPTRTLPTDPTPREHGRSVDPASLLPGELLLWFQRRPDFGSWEAYLRRKLASAKQPIRDEAAYLQPVILRILEGKEPKPITRADPNRSPPSPGKIRRMTPEEADAKIDASLDDINARYGGGLNAKYR